MLDGDDLLTWLMHIDDLRLDLNLVPWWQKCVESNDQVRVTFEQVRYTIYHTWCVNPEKEITHYVSEYTQFITWCVLIL